VPPGLDTSDSTARQFNADSLERMQENHSLHEDDRQVKGNDVQQYIDAENQAPDADCFAV